MITVGVHRFFFYFYNNTSKSNPIRISKKKNQSDPNVFKVIKMEKYFKNIWQLKV